jgi:hypothetical protein
MGQSMPARAARPGLHFHRHSIELAGLVGPAERAVTEAEAGVKEAARGVIRLRVSDLSAEIAALSARLEARRGIWKLPSEWQSAISFGVFLLFIVLRPRGFFGRSVQSADI